MKPRITIAPTPDTVVAQISNLPKLGMPEIKSLWRRLFGGDTPTHNRQFLERSQTQVELPEDALAYLVEAWGSGRYWCGGCGVLFLLSSLRLLWR